MQRIQLHKMPKSSEKLAKTSSISEEEEGHHWIQLMRQTQPKATWHAHGLSHRRLWIQHQNGVSLAILQHHEIRNVFFIPIPKVGNVFCFIPVPRVIESFPLRPDGPYFLPQIKPTDSVTPFIHTYWAGESHGVYCRANYDVALT